VAAQSEARVLGRLPAGNSGLNSVLAWMSVFSEFCVLSGRDFCGGPIPRPEESYRLCVPRIVGRCNDKPIDLKLLGTRIQINKYGSVIKEFYHQEG